MLGPIIAIVIPVYRDLSGLQMTIELIEPELEGLTYELVVANDGNSPAVATWLENKGIKHVYSTAQQGSYAMRNLGIAATTASKILFMDAGVLPQPGWWKLVQDNINKARYIAFNINVLIPSNAGMFQQYSRYTEFTCQKYWDKHHFGPTAFLCVHRTVFVELGAFDGSLQSGGDFELGNRCWRSGLSMTFVHNDLIYHPSRTLAKKLTRNIRVIKGLRQLTLKYSGAENEIARVDWTELALSPIRAVGSLMALPKSRARELGWPLAKLFIAELGHQIVYYAALTVAIIRK